MSRAAAACGLLLLVACQSQPDHDERSDALLAVGSSTIEAVVRVGGPNPASQILIVDNDGPCALALTASGRTSDGADWLSVTPTGTVLPGGSFLLTVGFDVVTPGLRPGTYIGTVELGGTCAWNTRPAYPDRVSVAVNLRVEQGGDFTVSGSVTGLAGDRIVLQNSDGYPIELQADDTFAFPVADGDSYAIQVVRSPRLPTQTCSVTSGSGTVSAANVAGVLVECDTITHQIGGSVVGLVGTGLVLLNNGTDPLPASGPSFAYSIGDGLSYEITVGTAPTGPTQSCEIIGGSGTVSGADVSDIVVDCYSPAIVGDRVWHDLDADGVQDGGEPGLPAVAVRLLDGLGTGLLDTTLTAGDGSYGFRALRPGDYRIELAPPLGFYVSQPDQGGDDALDSDISTSFAQSPQLSLSGGETNGSVDAGLYQRVDVGGRVWDDTDADGIQDGGEVGIVDVVVNLRDATGTTIVDTSLTDGAGAYAFVSLLPATYVIEIIAPGGESFSPRDQGGDDTVDSDVLTATGRTAPLTVLSGSGEGAIDAGLFVAAPGLRPLYGASTAWNDYVLNDGVDRFSASGTACVGNEAGPYNACVHAGELFEITVAGYGVCTGLTATDALDAFTWMCRPGAGDVSMVSTGLKPGRGLADLIDFATPGWRANSVTVQHNAAPVLTTTSEIWHTNPMAAAVTSLATAGTVYTVSSTTSVSPDFAADRVALVMAPGVRISGAVTVSTAPRFIWLEGVVDPTGQAWAVDWTDVRFSVMRNLSVQDRDIDLNSASSNRLVDVTVAYGRDGLVLDASSHRNQIERFRSYGSQLTGMRIYGNDNVLADATSGSTSIGVYVFGSVGTGDSNAIIGLSAPLTASRGLWLADAANTTVMNVAVVNGNIGIDVAQTLTTAQIRDLTSTDNATGVRTLSGGSADFTGLFKVGANTVGCRETITIVDCATLAPNATLVAGVSLGTSFVGPTTTDSINADGGATGATAYAFTMDMLGFENSRRTWGVDGTFPSAAVRDRCDSGTCRIYDWSASTSDTVARAVVPTPGTDTLTHTWTAADSGACASIAGAAWSGTACESTILVSSIEISDDGVGNENLLCEAGERCVHASNIGAYQGHGSLTFLTLGGPGGDIELYGYLTNGR